VPARSVRPAPAAQQPAEAYVRNLAPYVGFGHTVAMGRQWIVDAIGETAFGRLAEGMAGTELWSLLLEVLRERAGARTPADVLGQHRRDTFVQLAAVDQRTSVELDNHLLAAAAGFEALELSPVAPLGTCSSIALTDQHRVLSALRGTEVVSDPTNVLALECADRLMRKPDVPVRLATSHRVLRAQRVPDRPAHTQHFRLFVLATGGREVAGHGFVVQAMVEHVQTMLAALDRLERHGYAFGRSVPRSGTGSLRRSERWKPRASRWSTRTTPEG
jgi:hypothetical protein